MNSYIISSTRRADTDLRLPKASGEVFRRPGKAHITQVLSKLVAHQNSKQRQVLQHKQSIYYLVLELFKSFIGTKIDYASFVVA